MRRVLGGVAAGIVVAFCLVGSLLFALHRPEPHHVPVGLVAPDALAAQIGQRAGDALDVRRYADAEAAERAVRERAVAGAFVADPADPADAGGPRLLVAGANGAITRQVLEAAFTPAAGGTLTVRDVAPLPDADRAGASVFFFAVGVLVSSVAAGIVLGLGGAPRPQQAIGWLLAAAGVGGAAAWMAAGLVGALPGHGAALFGVAALTSAAICGTALALVRLLGHPGAGLAGLVLVVLGMPATGGPAGRDFLPSAYRWLSDVLPTGAAVDLVRRVLYFGGHGLGHGLLVLSAWVAGAALLLAASALRHRPEPSAERLVERSAALYR
jgi:hypothetical protein